MRGFRAEGKLLDAKQPSRAERLAILQRERPDPKPPEPKSGKTFVLVSGLPRSGTSLMMQMLQAGGLPALTDGERAADSDNPRGYLEWEPIKRIAREPDLLDDDALTGHAIKCVSPLLPQLPPKHDYKVIFMTRPVEEVARSQRAMVQRLETRGADLDLPQLARSLEAHREEIRRWLAAAPHIVGTLEVDYARLVADPASEIARIVAFLGPAHLPNAANMTAVIHPELHR